MTRVSLYFSERKDKDLIDALNLKEIEKGDINWIIKELLRDGIKYRSGEKTYKKTIINQNISKKDFEKDFNFDDIKIIKEELDERDIMKKLEII